MDSQLSSAPPVNIFSDSWRSSRERKWISEDPPPCKRRGCGSSTHGNTSTSESKVKPEDITKTSMDYVLSGHSCKNHFTGNYTQFGKLGEGGKGLVYAGQRKADTFPVAIKHIPKAEVPCQTVELNGRDHDVPVEVVLMYKAAGGPESVGKYAAVSLIDWYDLDQEVILVMERPPHSTDLLTFLSINGQIMERDAKLIVKQLVDAAIDMHSKGIFHRDIKPANILIQFGYYDPRVRIIDFGCGCMMHKEVYSDFSGTRSYTPPEFLIDREYQPEPTTVWQLAAVLFEMLDGILHFNTQHFLDNNLMISDMWSKNCRDLLKRCLTLEDRATLAEMKGHPWLK